MDVQSPRSDALHAKVEGIAASTNHRVKQEGDTRAWRRCQKATSPVNAYRGTALQCQKKLSAGCRGTVEHGRHREYEPGGESEV